MKLLFYTWNNYCKIDNESDMVDAFRELDNEVVCVELDINIKNRYSDKATILFCEEQIRNHTPDKVFSFGYFPVIAHACNNEGVEYLSWVYDNPCVMLYSYTLSFPTNKVFVFDYDTYDLFHNREGIRNIYYLPMAANVKRLDALLGSEQTIDALVMNKSRVAFVGSLYTERLNLYDRMISISDYTRGYLDALINSQMMIYGYNIVENLLIPEVLTEMIEDIELRPGKEGVESYAWLYANYVINRKITSIERGDMIKAIGKKYCIDLYTEDKSFCSEGVINHGYVDYYNVAPFIFKNASINLNITLRSIVNGIPLRCFDIMGSGGFLLTNYQADMVRFFDPDKDFVFFDSKESMMKKIEYYLLAQNESERKEIALSGHNKIMEKHTYFHRAQEILSY